MKYLLSHGRGLLIVFVPAFAFACIAWGKMNVWGWLSAVWGIGGLLLLWILNSEKKK